MSVDTGHSLIPRWSLAFTCESHSHPHSLLSWPASPTNDPSPARPVQISPPFFSHIKKNECTFPLSGLDPLLFGSVLSCTLGLKLGLGALERMLVRCRSLIKAAWPHHHAVISAHLHIRQAWPVDAWPHEHFKKANILNVCAREN